jgi:predicted PurR-regulated permease PerM
MWGGIAAVLNFVPYLGPAVTIGLLALAGLSTFDTLLQASYPVLAYLGISFVESNIVTPAIMSRRMTLNPLAIMLALSFWTWIWGPVGALISLPLLIMLKVVCDHTPSLRAVGAFIGGPLDRGRKRQRAEAADEAAEQQLVEEPDPPPESEAEEPGVTAPAPAIA